jgi:gliding motility-associated-like protein
MGLCCSTVSQNDMKKWYFGVQAGLDFMTNPPTVLTNGVMTALEGCASVADAGGNLLFYTDGATIWNQAHVPMANGAGLLGNSASGQSALIVKRPGSATIYYVITQGSGTGGLAYTTIDMSLAMGQGSVTVKNTTLVAPAQCTEKLTGTRHCNGVDFWIVTHDFNNNNFRSYLITALGVNNVPVISAVGSPFTGAFGYQGWMKISQNGKKLGAAMYVINGACELFNFDNSTGVVSNPLVLTGGVDAYGCEFSPDGTKFYAAETSQIYQWNLCAGAGAAIVASRVNIPAAAGYALQLATNGKIYLSRTGQQFAGVINNPNNIGLACNYVDMGQTLSPRSSNVSIPNFISGYMKQHITPPPFTYVYNNTTGCQTASFAASPNPSVYCPAAGYSLTGILWNFGDPASGALNSSTLTNPSHFFTTTGNYTVQQILYYSCGGGSDTLIQPVSILGPSISVNSTAVSCSSLGSATLNTSGGVGPFSYTWTPTAQTSSVASGLSPGNYTISIFDNGVNCAFTSTLNLSPPLPITGTVVHTSSLSCNAATNGSAAVGNLSGGSGNQSYLWTNGINTQTTSVATGLGAGSYSLTTVDALTGCVFSQSFQITQPPAISVNISASSASVCAGSSIILTASASGGSQGFSYSWVSGPQTVTYSASQATGGNYIYSVTATDANNCSSTNTIAVSFANSPVLSLTSVSTCPQTAGTLTVSGAVSYTWSNNSNGNTLTDNPAQTSVYSVTGAVAGCTAGVSANIVVLGLPSPSVNINNPVCTGQTLAISGGGGVGYIWSGPSGFSSSLQSFSISPVNNNHGGIYSLTVSSAFGCTAATSGTVVILPSPSLSAVGSTVCQGQAIALTCNSSANSFNWTGPNAFNSTLQNPILSGSSTSLSGSYTIVVSSISGCTSSSVADVTVTAMPIVYITGPLKKCEGDAVNLSGNGGGSYNWSGPNGYTSGFQNAFINNIPVSGSGIYSLTVMIGPCISLATHSLTIYTLPTLSLSGLAKICETKSLSLMAYSSNNIATYVWQGPGGYVQNGQLAGRDSCKIGYSGLYTITVTDFNSCTAWDTIQVSILQNPTVSATGATVCLNSRAVISASGASSYLWTGSNSFYSGLASPTISSANSTTTITYSVTGTAVNGCSAAAVANVNTWGLPTATLEVIPKSRVCLNNNVTLIGKGGQSYNWSGPNGINFSGDSVNMKLSSLNFAGFYTLTVSDKNGCQAHRSALIEIDDLPTGGLSTEKMQGCVPFCSEFSFHAPLKKDSLTTVEWEIGNSILRTKTFSYCFDSKGEYVIKGKITDNISSCQSRVVYTVQAFPNPIADFSLIPLKPVEMLDEAVFVNGSKGEKQNEWHWFFKESAMDTENKAVYKADGQQVTYRYKEAGFYPVALLVKNEWGCSDSIVKIVEVIPDFNIYIPNVFTPNGDGLNDTFLPVVSGVRNYELSVFNHNGLLIFSSKDPLSGWDGSYNGAPCQNQIYTWKIVLSTTEYYKNGVSKELFGHVMLCR